MVTSISHIVNCENLIHTIFASKFVAHTFEIVKPTKLNLGKSNQYFGIIAQCQLLIRILE